MERNIKITTGTAPDKPLVYPGSVKPHKRVYYPPQIKYKAWRQIRKEIFEVALVISGLVAFDFIVRAITIHFIK